MPQEAKQDAKEEAKQDATEGKTCAECAKTYADIEQKRNE